MPERDSIEDFHKMLNEYKKSATRWRCVTKWWRALQTLWYYDWYVATDEFWQGWILLRYGRYPTTLEIRKFYGFENDD